MTIDELLAEMREKRPPVPERELHELEAKVGHRLPEDYRRFLLACNGGFLQGRFAFGQLSSISSVYGLRDDISLMRMWEVMRGACLRS